MIRWFQRQRAKHRAAKQKATCRTFGHLLTKRGFGQDGKVVSGVPVAEGPETMWIMMCACGYGEAAPVGCKPYSRSWEEGQRMLKEQNGGINA